MSHAQTSPEPVPTVPASNPVDTVIRDASKVNWPLVRLWLYGVFLAAIPLLSAYGAISHTEEWTSFGEAVLGVSGLTTAIANISR